MCAALIGDLGWMSEFFGKDSVDGRPHVFLTGAEAGLDESMFAADVVVLITDQVPHAVRRRVLYAASSQDLPVFMRHSSGAPSVKSFLLSMPGKGEARAA